MQTLSKSDVYTKCVLTVIAACLVWICMRDVSATPAALAEGTTTSAADSEVNVANVSLSEYLAERSGEVRREDVPAVRIVGLELDGPLPVVLAGSETTPVRIVGVDVPHGMGPSYALPVTFSSRVVWDGE